MGTKVNLYKQSNKDDGIRVNFNVPRSLTYGLNARANDDGGVSEADNCTYNTLNGINTLLSSASLMLTPSSYKEGKLYSVIPSNGNGDFTVTRATTATRINSAGLVELVPYNLFQYSEDFSNGYWAKTNATITVNTTTAPNFTLTADTITDNATNGQHKVQTAALSDLVTGASFVASAYVKANTATRACLYAYGTSLGVGVDLLTGNQITVSGLTNASPGQVTITNVGNGWYYIELRATVAGAFSIAIMMVNGTDFSYAGSGNSLYYWGAQLTEGTIAKPYQKTETRLNIPRIDYSLGGCPNILLEPQRTNLALQSSSFDNASWTKSETAISANVTTAPDGTLTADKFIPSANNVTHQIRQTGFTSAAYTFSVYAKAGEETTFSLWLRSASVFAVFDLSSGTITSQSGSVTATITSVGDGWYRCTAYDPTPGTTAQLYARSGSAFAGNGANGFFIWGAQLEQGAYATSYIPTTTASVTRNADSITRNNIFTNGLITASGGTWFVELRNVRTITRDSFVQAVGIGNALPPSVTNGFYLSNAGGSLTPTFRKNISTTETSLLSLATGTVKLAVKWNGSTMDVFQNGVKVVNATAFAITNMEFLFGYGNDVPKFINEMALFPTPLTDAQCIALTQ